MRSALENISDETRERVLQFNRDLGDRLQERWEDADIVLLDHRVDIHMPDDSTFEIDLRDVDQDALVLEFALKPGHKSSAEIVGVTCDEKGVDRVMGKINRAEFLQGCDELDEIFDTDRGMSLHDRKWKLDIAHDRVLTADLKLEQALESLGDLAQGGVIDVELHDEVYDLRNSTRRIKRTLNKLRLRQGTSAVFTTVRCRSSVIDQIDGLRDIVGDTDFLSIEYRFIEQGGDVSIEWLEDVHRHNLENDVYELVNEGTKKRLLRLSTFVEWLKADTKRAFRLS